MKHTTRKSTIRVKSRRGGHITNLGNRTDKSLFNSRVDYYGEPENLELFRKALDGDISGLLKILNSREKDRLFSYLNNLRKQQ